MSDVVVCQEDFDVGAHYQKLCNSCPQAGAVVFFVGRVRDFYDSSKPRSPDNEIEYLELEHYPGMTEQLCQEIIDQAKERFSFDGARVVHRVGKILASEQIVMVAVASAHRETAFQAAQYIMDFLKTRATFWKKEVGAKGQHWLGQKFKDKSASESWD